MHCTSTRKDESMKILYSCSNILKKTVVVKSITNIHIFSAVNSFYPFWYHPYVDSVLKGNFCSSSQDNWMEKPSVKLQADIIAAILKYYMSFVSITGTEKSCPIEKKKRQTDWDPQNQKLPNECIHVHFVILWRDTKVCVKVPCKVTYYYYQRTYKHFSTALHFHRHNEDLRQRRIQRKFNHLTA